MQRQFNSSRFAFSSAIAVLAWIGALMPLTLHAAPATLASAAALRAERYVDAKELARLAKGTRVETLKSEAGWVQVRVGGNVGWLRASQLSGTGVPAAKAKEDGRSGPDNVMAISGIRSMPPASHLAAATLSDIHGQRDAGRKVSVTLRNPVLSIGKDVLDFSVTSSHDGYLYVILLGSDNKSLYMLFPNDLDQDNAIKAEKALRLPRRKWEIKAQGPSGTNRMLVFVAASPRDPSEIGSGKAGPFLTMLTDANGRPDLRWLLGVSEKSTPNECRDGAQQLDRNVAQKCSDAFGATLIDIVEQ